MIEQVLNQKEKEQHLEKAFAQHSVLLLQFVTRMSKELEVIVTRDPRMISRSPQLLSNYDSLIHKLCFASKILFAGKKLDVLQNFYIPAECRSRRQLSINPCSFQCWLFKDIQVNGSPLSDLTLSFEHLSFRFSHSFSTFSKTPGSRFLRIFRLSFYF